MKITMGQFYPTDSVIHRLDARIKIILSFCFLTFIFISRTFIGNFISLGFLFFVIFLSKIPVAVILTSIKNVIFLLSFSFVTNLFFNQGGNTLFEFYFIRITTDGLLYSTRMVFRLSILIVGSSMLTFTTQILDFADGLENLMTPLKKIKFPAHEISMMLTIALRFIPTIIDELNKIKNAQISRGADFETGGLIKRIKNFIPILIPLFLSSFKRANELAMAMETRCYRGDVNRTKLKQLHITKIDYYAIAFLIIYLAIILLVRFTIET